MRSQWFFAKVFFIVGLPALCLPGPGLVLPAGAPSASSGTNVVTGSFDAWRTGGENSGRYAVYQVVDVQGQPFASAWRVRLKETPDQSYRAQLTTPLSHPVERGDVMLASFYVRCLESQATNGLGMLDVYISTPTNREPPVLSQRILPGKHWTLVQIPGRARGSHAAREGRVMLNLGFVPQVLEVAGFQLIDYGPAAKLEALPKSGY